MSLEARLQSLSRPVPSTDSRDMDQRQVTPSTTEPFVVMTPAGTRLLGLFGLLVAFGLGIWAWTSDGPLWWKTLMSAIGLPFLAVGSQYLVLGRYPTILLDQVGITYRPYEDAITLLRRGPIVRLRWDEVTSIGTERGRHGNRWLTIRSNRTRQRPRWLRALGTGERAPFIRISLSVLPESEEKLVEQLRVRALPHRFVDERDA